MSEECLSDYGGPVLPSVALGGFLKEGEQLSRNARYNEATALILTFLVNNKNEKSQVNDAGFIINYVVDQNSETITATCTVVHEII